MREMPQTEAYSIKYWLRSVRIGLLVTMLVIGVLVLLPFVPHRVHIDTPPYLLILAAGSVGGLGVALLPWERLFQRGMGLYFLYAWSAGDILLVSLGIAATGGGRSELFVVYGLTTVFFGASYPLIGQVALLLFTFACYVVALAATGWDIDAAGLLARLASLAILVVLTSFLSRELMRQMASEERSRADAERWASHLSTIAHSARSMTLDPDRVYEVALDSILGLGFHRAAVCTLDQDGSTYRVVQAHGLPPEYAQRLEPAALAATALVLKSGKSITMNEEGHPGSMPLLRDAGAETLVGSPIWAEGWLQAVLIGASRDRDQPSNREIEAFELLAAQAGMALQNARQFEAEHRTVERLEELDRMKTDFLTTVSHELRTPVTVIEGTGLTMERIWDSLDDATRKDLLGGLVSNAKVLHGLITNLLDFSRLEGGHAETNFGPTDLSALLLATGERLDHLFSQHHLQVDVEQDLIVESDPLLIDRVVENLLANAAKHTPAGTTVRLSAHRGNGDVTVSVADDGPGIGREDLAHLGERFYRGGEINTRTRGLGLGLAIVREILGLHATDLVVETNPGAGCRFSFTLPAVATTDRLPASMRPGA